MAKEIERKFIVDKNKLNLNDIHERIEQGYILQDDNSILRIRLSTVVNTQKAYLTIKTKNKGITRDEFEYEIPIQDAKQLLSLCNKTLKKNRYVTFIDSTKWEIDVFDDFDFIIAEVELESEDQEITIPDFVIAETHDPKYFNSNLIKLLEDD